MAALIKHETGTDPDVVEGDRGEFTVWVGGVVVARKESSDEEILGAVQHAVHR